MPVWDDWQVVGRSFRRFDDLEEDRRAEVRRGTTHATPVTIRDDLLWGSVFRFVRDVAPVALAAVFHDYDGQVRFVPGMTETRVVGWAGKCARVYHRINPLTFVAPAAQRRWPAAIYGALTYAYFLDEEVFPVAAEEGEGYAIRWTIPVDTQVLGARENGEIQFTPFSGGTLVTYNNATEPFGYRALRAWLPDRFVERGYGALGELARDYYRRTVDGFVESASVLAAAEVGMAIERMQLRLREGS